MAELSRTTSTGRRLMFADLLRTDSDESIGPPTEEYDAANDQQKRATYYQPKKRRKSATAKSGQAPDKALDTDEPPAQVKRQSTAKAPSEVSSNNDKRKNSSAKVAYTKIKINKVAPAKPEVVVDPIMLPPQPMGPVRKRQGPSTTGLTVLPSKPAFIGGLASVTHKPIAQRSHPAITHISQKQLLSAALGPPKNVYEVQMPKVGRRATLEGNQAFVAPTPKRNPFSPEGLTLSSVVDKLKAIYGRNFGKSGTRKFKKHKLKERKADSDSDDDDERVKSIPGGKLSEETAELLTMRLYGNQSDVIQEFLEERRDCERELVFSEAAIPTWVKYFWKVNLIYEFCTSCLLLYSVFYGAYAAVFRNHSPDVSLLGRLDYLIAADCIVRLLMELWRSKTKCQYEVFVVNYTFLLALLDLLALSPCIYGYMTFCDPTNLAQIERIPLFLIAKVFHIFRMIKILDKLQDDMNITGHLQFVLAMTYYIIQYLLIVHLLSCLIFYVGGRSYIDWLLNSKPETTSEKEYVTFISLRARFAKPPDEFANPHPLPFGLYALSVYIVVATISTVGFGDFFPTNTVERILIILMMMIGSIWISGELAYNLGTFFTDLDATRYMMFFRVRCIKIHLQNYQVSNFISIRTEMFYQHLWRYRKGVHEIDLSYLPHCVQEELKFDICEEMFFKSPMFRDLDETFLMVLAKTAKVSLYSPKMIIFERGSITKQMCFILQGEVAVAAGLDDDHISAIHRAGCLIGEVNLFMSIPYEQTIHTRTVCTIMTITKKDLMLTLQDFPHIFSIMRERVKKRRERFRNAFTLVQANPYVQWMYPKSLDDLKCDPEFPVKVCSMGGLNKPVTNFPMEDEDEQVIIEMPCLREDLKRIESQAYRLVSVPQIFYSPGFWASVLNTSMLGLWFYICWVTPGCAAFDDFGKDTYFSWCNVISQHWYAIIFVCVVDFFVELVTACPSTGLYYKIMDGIEVKKTSLGFYFDLLSIVPFELFHANWLSSLIRMGLKLWKINRLWDYLDERFALKLFFVRLGKLTYNLLYLVYLVSLLLLCLVCKPGRKNTECNEISFYNPAFPYSRYTRMKDNQNADENIFITPLVFATSALTSVGFGNIYPQTTKEIEWIIVIMILGHFFCSYFLAQLTSALSARLSPKLIFHQKLLMVKTFVRLNGLSTNLLRKLIEHYDLQHQYVRGCSLPESTHLMYDGHKVLLEDVFLVEGEIFFDGVPAFAKIPSQAIIDMSRLMQRFVVPPDLVFVQRGEVRRTLYIIVNGSVALYQYGEKAASAILTSTGHFGLRDLLFGEPYVYRVKTLSYVVLYAVDHKIFQEVLGDDEGLMDYIKDEMTRREDEVEANAYHNVMDEDGPSQRQVFPPSWIYYADHPDKPRVGGDKSFDQFEKPFLYYRGSNFIRENTMAKIIHPAGTFGMMWQATMGLAAVANMMFLIIETLMGYKGPEFRYIQVLLDLLFCADIYMKCHWSYYSAGIGEMRYHPLKTWVRYIFHGPFFIEVGMMIPLELIITFSGSTNLFGYGLGHSWFTKLRWIRFLRCFKFIELYTIVHRIFDNRTTVMFLFYLSITMLMATGLTALAFFFACPTLGYAWTEGDESKLPVCLTGTWVNRKAEVKLEFLSQWNRSLHFKGITDTDTNGDAFFARTFAERLVLGLYYVGQVLMVIGFGDLATFRGIELNFLTSIALFGFIVSRAIMSDITSAQVDTDEVRAINREKLERLSIALSREGAPKSFRNYVRAAFRISWSYTKGLQPNDLFADLHPVLHRELLAEYFGNVIERVPIFLGFTDAFINALKFKLKTELYPKGGLVTRAGDMDYRMYIIVQGEIWVCNKDDVWLCTMSTGESVGEMSILYAAKRRFSAYAATNLQLLVLDALDFADLLDTYPVQRKAILKILMDYKRETYMIKAAKWKSRNPDDYMKEQEEKTKLLESFSFRSLFNIPVGGNLRLSEKEKLSAKPEPKFHQKLFGYGSSDLVDCYLYLASDDESFNLVIHPSCKFNIHFQILVEIVRFVGPILVIFHVFFYVKGIDSDVTKWTLFFSQTFDIILWISILLRFFTAVEVSKRKTYCKELKKITADYLLRPDKFAYDLLVAFPYDIITGDNGTPFMGLRCLLSVKYFSDMWKLKDDIEVSTLQVKLTTSLSFLLYSAHILACLFFYLSCPNIQDNAGKSQGIDQCNVNGWIHEFRIEFGKKYGHSANMPVGAIATDVKDLYTDNDPSHWYIVSLYWVMAVLTTCGFGDITPTNYPELTLAIFCVFFGSLFLSILLGNITTGLGSVNKARHQFLGRVEKMLDYLEVIGLSSVGRQTLSAYCKMTWTNCRGVNYNDIADILPLYVQQDVYLALYHNCVTNCLFFGKDYELSFVRAICSRLRHYMFLPGMRIANELEPGTGIFIVMRGSVTSFQKNPTTGEREFIKRYETNQVFGRIPALYPGALYNKCYRAEDKTEVLLMYHADMRQLIIKYPRWRIFLKEVIAKEYSYFMRKTDLKNITERKLATDEKLTKDLTYEQFSKAANLFASEPPNRTGVTEVEKKRKVEVARTVRTSIESESDLTASQSSRLSISISRKPSERRRSKQQLKTIGNTTHRPSGANMDDIIKAFAGQTKHGKNLGT